VSVSELKVLSETVTMTVGLSIIKPGQRLSLALLTTLSRGSVVTLCHAFLFHWHSYLWIIHVNKTGLMSLIDLVLEPLAFGG
jgi:hypothetical protein